MICETVTYKAGDGNQSQNPLESPSRPSSREEKLVHRLLYVPLDIELHKSIVRHIGPPHPPRAALLRPATNLVQLQLVHSLNERIRKLFYNM